MKLKWKKNDGYSKIPKSSVLFLLNKQNILTNKILSGSRRKTLQLKKTPLLLQLLVLLKQKSECKQNKLHKQFDNCLQKSCQKLYLQLVSR